MLFSKQHFIGIILKSIQDLLRFNPREFVFCLIAIQQSKVMYKNHLKKMGFT